MDIHVYIHSNSDQKLDDILNLLKDIIRKEETIMATLDQIVDDVTAEKGQIASMGKLMSDLKQALADALAGTTLPAAVQAKVDDIFAKAEENKAALAAAINANP
jgi:uncharacterized protein YqeY